MFEGGNKVIAAVKDYESLKRAIEAKVEYVFLLKGSICDINKMVNLCHKNNIKVFIHMDMIDGFGKDEASIEYVSKYFKPDGIISTKAGLITYAHKYNLEAVFRVFIVDTYSLSSAISNINKCKAEYVEIMPGIIPELAQIIGAETSSKFIAGGLVSSKKHVDKAFEYGFIAVSTSNEGLWK